MNITRSAFGDDQLNLTWLDVLRLVIYRRLSLKYGALTITLGPEPK